MDNDNTIPIVPTFNGQLEHGAVALCDFFLIDTEDKIIELVVKIVMVTKSGKKHKFPVGPGKYKMALFLLYCAVLRGSRSFSFDFDNFLKNMLVPYFGAAIIENSRLAETSHTTLQLLVLETDLEVSLVLKPGYELPKNPGRTVRKLIEHGWTRHDSGSLHVDSPVPLIRQALTAFLQAERDGTIRIVGSWDPKVWPSNTWQNRAWNLYNQLGMRKSAKTDKPKTKRSA
jgi:hypothetical protein